MRKTSFIALLLLPVVMFASAQTKPPTLPEATRDTLYPEIVGYLGFGEYLHYQHPATELSCGFDGIFCTIEPYNQYLWEVDEDFLPIGGDLTDYRVICGFTRSGYLKVTVWDSIGNSGTDSIWFNIKDWIDPMPDFTMELDSTNHAVFSGTATSDHRAFSYYRSLDTLSWPQGGEHHDLRPGYWSIRDNDAWFTSDSIWNYKLILIDSCGYYYEQEMVPGMMMGTQPAPGGGWYLTMKSVMQSNKKALEGRDGEEYVYALYTIDHQGVRHPYVREGSHVILPTSTQAYLLPGRHPDEYYQGGVGKLTGGRDGELQILSYSNKVENPLPDLDGVDDIDGNGTNTNFKNLKVWPNPAKDAINLEGEGRLTVYDAMGRRIMDRTLDGKLTLTLPSGMYLVRLVNGTTNETVKVVVE